MVFIHYSLVISIYNIVRKGSLDLNSSITEKCSRIKGASDRFKFISFPWDIYPKIKPNFIHSLEETAENNFITYK